MKRIFTLSGTECIHQAPGDSSLSEVYKIHFSEVFLHDKLYVKQIIIITCTFTNFNK